MGKIDIRLEVAVAAPVHKCYSYLAPAFGQELIGSNLDSLIGRRVYVPFGKRKVTGYVLDVGRDDELAIDLKTVYEILDDQPLFHHDIIPLFRWISDYYHYPIGQVIQTALPSGLTVQSKKIVRLKDNAAKKSVEKICLNTEPAEWIKRLISNGQLSFTTSRDVLNTPAEKRMLKKLLDADLVEVTSKRTVALTKKKTETCYRIDSRYLVHDQKGTVDAELSIEKMVQLTGEKFSRGERNTLEKACLLADTVKNNLVPRKELIACYPYAQKLLPSLVDRGAVERVERRIFRSPYGDLLPYIEPIDQLTDEQSSAVEEITRSIIQDEYCTFLLHGITGSGKTEVYLRAAEQALKCGRSVLVLVPEIALATQVEAHFVSRFGNKVALLHSGLTDGERFDEWSLVWAGERSIVIGARSSVFAPLKNCGLIIVDEEHDSSFKQEDKLRYNSRDLAILRGRQAGSTVILGSATPSITSYYHCQTNKFKLLEMRNRVGDSSLPHISLVDLKDEKRTNRNDIFSQQLIGSLKETYESGDQSMLLMNRRGFSASVICRDCGSMVECNHCNVTLNMHKGKKRLLCHYCGFQLPINITCNSCGSEHLYPVGFGTERVEERVKELLPGARIARLDSDVAADRKRFMSILHEVRNHEIDILIGTQMIAKGLHFPRVTLVGVIWADGGLSFPDFRAAEKTFQLISQVTGRAGRGRKPGKVIIQTMQPNHYAIRLAAEHGYHEFVKQETNIRDTVSFPPFTRLVSIRVEGASEAGVRKYAAEIAQDAGKWCRNEGAARSVQILGPAPAPIEKLKDTYRWHLLVKSNQITKLHDLIRYIQSHHSQRAKEKLIIDVDPDNML